MDMVSQNKINLYIILFLVVVNIILVSFVWIFEFKRDGSSSDQRPDDHRTEGVEYMREVLDLNEGQTSIYEKTHADMLDELKEYNGQMVELKKQIAMNLFQETYNEAAMNMLAGEIGRLQSSMETCRSRHFHDFIEVCRPEQKRILKEILIESFGRVPQKENKGEPPPR